MSWLGRGRPPRKSVGGHENSLRDAMRLAAGVVVSHETIGAVVWTNLVSPAREVQIAVSQNSMPRDANGMRYHV